MLRRVPLGWRLLAWNFGVPLVILLLVGIPLVLITGEAWLLWIVGGIAAVQGLFMTMFLAFAHVYGVTNGGQTSGQGRLSVNQHRVVSLPMSVDAALGAIDEALVRLGVPKAAIARPTTRTRTGDVGAGFESWGEVVSVEVTGVDGAIEVHIRSRPRVWITMVDYGKNEANVRRLATALSDSFPSSSASSVVREVRIRPGVTEA